MKKIILFLVYGLLIIAGAYGLDVLNFKYGFPGNMLLVITYLIWTQVPKWINK